MRAVRRALAALAVAGLSACTADGSTDAGAPPPSAAPSSPAGASPSLAQPDPAQAGVDDGAVAAFGAAQVAAASTTAAEIARIALADCVRWTTGEVDPRLTALVAPELITRSLAELDRAREYGGSPVPSLLSHLPDDDGNGHDLVTALARGGCDGSAPLHYPSGPVRVSLAPGERPGLVVSGGFAMNVGLGPAVVSAGQDWVFTLEPDAGGWRLTDVAPVMANVNWAPEMRD